MLLNRLKILFSILIVCAVMGCSVKNQESQWENTKNQNTVEAYQNFLEDFPGSEFTDEALAKIDSLKKLQENTKQQVKSRKVVKRPAKKSIPTDTEAFAAAKAKNTIKSYEQFKRKYPKSPLVRRADQRIIDLKVTVVSKKPHGSLPQAVSYGSTGGRSYSILSIHNNTKYKLHCLFSGPYSFETKFKPGEKSAAEILNGTYRISAKVDIPNVISFYGKQSYDGGDYMVQYYIVFGNAPVKQPVRYLSQIETYPIKYSLPEGVKAKVAKK